jgi:cytochrome c-type biogenesis protein CcmE
MTRKQQRLLVVAGGMALLGVAAALVLSAFQDNLVFFYSPSEVVTRDISPERPFRLGGLVEEASVVQAGVTTTFRVTDRAHAVAVTFTGLLPDLFREGQGVVAEGRINGAGIFEASRVLAKHDENYMPPEVAEALMKAGQWRPEGTGQSP